MIRESLTLFATLLSLTGWTQSETKYFRPSKGGGHTIILKEDSTYYQKMGDCTWGFSSTGKWSVFKDTVYLKADKLYGRDKKKLKLPITENDRVSRFGNYQSMNKFIFSKDSLCLSHKPNFVLYKK